ncbi:hypothetical protein GTY70_02805 [Stenotrophomonas maltophilia]|nr:hypothetical protein [Stenotrophomonas pavanii]MCF3462810.1 hypothetical protein [Stenotrophomonas maltophilia]MCF3507327.1 hypothetical protein [Stenotrophomonas maltophilia]
MTSKHTKSPWNIEMNNHHTGSIATVYGCTDGYADIWSESWVDTGMPKEEHDANARLIAAAPDLLEALSKAVRETEQFLFDAWLVRVCPSGDVESVQHQWLASSDHREFFDEWREQIDAIAKATGEGA